MGLMFRRRRSLAGRAAESAGVPAADAPRPHPVTTPHDDITAAAYRVARGRRVGTTPAVRPPVVGRRRPTAGRGGPARRAHETGVLTEAELAAARAALLGR